MATKQREALGTTDEVAEYLQVNPGTLRNWRSQSRGPAYRKVGVHIRYRWRDVDAWLDQQQTA
jgi:excisionase family DNA binding protein